MENGLFWAGMATMLLLEGFGYFIWTRIKIAKRKRESRDAYIPLSKSRNNQNQP